jgi:hypothetical protein
MPCIYIETNVIQSTLPLFYDSSKLLMWDIHAMNAGHRSSSLKFVCHMASRRPGFSGLNKTSGSAKLIHKNDVRWQLS